MSREIKFKYYFQHNDTGTIVVKILTLNEIERCELSAIHTKLGTRYGSPFAVTQYTGLKDKKGTEIYEGDIVEVKYKNTEKFIGSVFYEMRFASYMVTSPHSCYGIEDFGTHTNEDIRGIWDEKRALYYEELKAEGLEGFYKYCEKRYKVIGNKYENPELLTGEINTKRINGRGLRDV